MKNKLVFGAGLAVGYVLGTRAGRQSYEQIRTKAQQLWNNPKVQDTVASTTGTLKSKAPEVQEKLQGVLKKGGAGAADDGAKAPQTPGADVGASGDLPLGVPPVVSALDDAGSGTSSSSGTSGMSGIPDDVTDLGMNTGPTAGLDSASDGGLDGGGDHRAASDITPGTLGPSGGDPLDIEEPPFGQQDEDTRPDLGK